MKTQTQETHAVASPSDYKRWMNCSGSLNLERKLIEKGLIPEWEESSPAAAEGTRLHELAEKVLTGDILICPSEVKDYVDFCRSITPEGVEVFVEEKVPLFYSKGETGTVDYAVRHDEVLRLVDLKTGRIKVAAENNFQMLIYAMGLITPETQRIEMTIFQYDKPHTWSISKHQAHKLCHQVAEAAAMALDETTTELTQSTNACRWCRAKPYCTAHTGSAINMLDEVSHGDMQRISDAQLVNLLAQKKKITDLLNHVEKVMFDRLDNGESIDGLHIGTGRKGNKTWKKGIDAVEEMVKLGIHLDQAVKHTPITPTQALKLASIPEDFYEQPEGKPKLEVDGVVDVDEMFEDI